MKPNNLESVRILSVEQEEREANYLIDYLYGLYPEQDGVFTNEQYQNAHQAIMDSFLYTDAKVYLTRQCNGECPFCLTDMRPTTREVEDQEFLEKFKSNIDEYYNKLGRKILFTGGEPTINPKRLLGCLEVLKDYDMDLVVLYTNGTKLSEEIEYKGVSKPLLDHLRDCGLRNINLSVHDYDAERRTELSHEIGKMDTEALIKDIIESGINLRLNCTLMKDFIGDKEAIVKYIEWANKNGVRDIYFRDLFEFVKRDKSTLRQTPSSMQKLKFTDDQRIDFWKLIESMDEEDGFKLEQQMFRHKDWGSTFVFTYTPTKSQVSFGHLNIGGENAEEDTYYAIHPDGIRTRNMNVAENTVEESE